MLDAAELLEGVTPGPWLHEHRETKVSGGMYSTEIYTEDGGSGHGVIATLSWYPRPMDERGAIGTYREANARLIASAPRLARRVIELEEALAEARPVVEAMTGTEWAGVGKFNCWQKADDSLRAIKAKIEAALKGEGDE